MSEHISTASGVMTVKSRSLETAQGELRYRLTNDVLFHIVSQSSSTSLIHLLTAVLGYPVGRIVSVEVLNPIHYNDHIDSKEIILDVLIRMNTGEIANIEIQVAPYPYWTNRSLFYAARQIGRQKPGGFYKDLGAVHQISIMDFTLFQDHVRFHEIYQLKSLDGTYVYTDKLDFHVVDLTQIALADKTDEQSGLKYWAELFRASSWEEIRSLVKKDDRLREVAQIMYGATTDEHVNYYVKTREDIIDDYNGFIQTVRSEAQSEAEEWKKKTEELRKESVELQSSNAELQNSNAELQNSNAELQAKTSELEDKAADLESKNNDLAKALDKKDAEIRELRRQLAAKNV